MSCVDEQLASVTPGVGRDDTGLERQADTLMQAYTGRVPGASVLVVRDGVALLRSSYGLADLETGAATTPCTNYRLASVSKQFTAAAVLLLAEEHRLRLDDRLRHWLPTLPRTADAIRLHHLLTHTSGLIDYEDLMDPADSRQVRDADVLRLLENEPRTHFPPGTGYRYSNGGYALLALVVERATGRGYAQVLRERIFRPLGMEQTLAYEAGRSEVAQRAYGHRFADGRWQRADQDTTSAVLGDGGIYSSIDDLARWDAALDDGRLLGAVSRRLAFTPATATDDPDVHYGFGWRITGDTHWHSGESIGFRNVILRDPGRRVTVVVLTNRDDPEPYAIAKMLAALASA